MGTPPQDLAQAARTQDESALKSLLGRAALHDRAVIPHDLLQFGLLGSLIVIATGLVALILPSAAAIRHDHFFLLFGGATAGLDTLMGSLAAPAIVCGFALLALDLYLMRTPTGERWRTAVVAQAAAGGASAVVFTLFLALVLLNLVIWILIVAAVIAAIGALLAGAAS
jgi:hypothetical protein